jgi:hypothetical protein
MIEVFDPSGDITFVVYDDVIEMWTNQDYPNGLIRIRLERLLCRHVSLLRVATWHNFLTELTSNKRVASPMKGRHVAHLSHRMDQ